MLWGILAVGIAAIAVLLFFSFRKHKQMVTAGEIISRKPNFMENAEEFTLSLSDPGSVTDGIRNLPCRIMSVSVQGNTESQLFRFRGTQWEAKLKRISEESGSCVYRFEFTSWKKSNGMALDALNMNRRLTAVEKLFLSLDPDTSVREIPLEYHTKRSLL